MTALNASHDTLTETTIVHYAADNVVPAQVIRRGSRPILLILGLFLAGATLAALVALGKGLLAIGIFEGFCMMMLIGLPLLLACVGDSLENDQG